MTTGSSPAASGVSTANRPVDSKSISQRDLKIVGVDVVFDPLHHNSFQFAGLSSDKVERIVRQVYADALGAVSSSGQIEARAQLTLKIVAIANPRYRYQMAAMDSVLMSEVRLFRLGSEQQVGPLLKGLNQATFSPFGGRTPLPPEEELRMIASYASQKLVKKIH